MSYAPSRPSQTRRSRIGAKPYDRVETGASQQEREDESSSWLAKFSGALAKPINWVFAPITQTFSGSTEAPETSGDSETTPDMAVAEEPSQEATTDTLDDNNTITLDIFLGHSISEMSEGTLKKHLESVNLNSEGTRFQLTCRLKNYVLEHPETSKPNAVLTPVPTPVPETATSSAPAKETDAETTPVTFSFNIPPASSSAATPAFSFKPVVSAVTFPAPSAASTGSAFQFNLSSIPVLKMPAPEASATKDTAAEETFSFSQPVSAMSFTFGQPLTDSQVTASDV